MLTYRTDVWGAVASTCSSVFALLGLSAIWFQLRAGHAAMQANIDAQVYARLDTINSILVERPELEKMLQKPFNQESDDAVATKNLADMFFTFFEQIHRQKSSYASPQLLKARPLMTEEQWQAWELTIVNAMRYPFLLGYWRQDAHSRYAPSFSDQIYRLLDNPKYQEMLNTKP